MQAVAGGLLLMTMTLAAPSVIAAADCPSNSISSGASVCLSCVRGKNSNGSAACTACDQGKYSSRTAALGESTCQTCPEHSDSRPGSASPAQCLCNAGYTGAISSDIDRLAVMYANTSNISNASHLSLSYLESWASFQGSPILKGACSACVAGKFKPANGTGACSVCPAGKFSNRTAGKGCDICPRHTFSPAGSDNITDCVCNKGYTGIDGEACFECVAGSYKGVNGSAACTACDRGKYSSRTAALDESTCQTCPEHSDSRPGSASPAQCLCNAGYT